MFTPAPAWLQLIFGLALAVLGVLWIITRTFGWIWDSVENWWATHGPGARKVEREVREASARRRESTAWHLQLAADHLNYEHSSPEFGLLAERIQAKAFNYFHGTRPMPDELPRDFGIQQAEAYHRSWSALSEDWRREVLANYVKRAGSPRPGANGSDR
ncbi:hypothetical protein [Nocardioides sp.]|uniref:hypothetical protein n=1 Tax=Nocardioides sp. TaxID=35761 RepID=UPI0037846C71